MVKRKKLDQPIQDTLEFDIIDILYRLLDRFTWEYLFEAMVGKQKSLGTYLKRNIKRQYD